MCSHGTRRIHAAVKDILLIKLDLVRIQQQNDLLPPSMESQESSLDVGSADVWRPSM